MFLHHLKYSLKNLFRNKMLIFWTFAFPIIMALFFNMAFSNITDDEKLKVFDIAVVKSEELEKNIFLTQALNSLSKENTKEQLFRIDYTSFKEAKQKLEEKKIIGYINIEKENTIVTVKKNGIEETVLQNVIKEIEKQKKIVLDIIETKKSENSNTTEEMILMEAIQAVQQEIPSMIEDKTQAKLDYTMIEYYTLIAMACLYGAIFGMTIINNALPNMSKKGMRVNISPAKKATIVVSGALASFIAQVIGLALLFLFTIFVIKVDYGNQIGYIILLALIGCLAGLSLGIVVGTTIKKEEGLKLGILISITMLGCFLSGMMGITMKYIVDTNIPILNKINPANMITDGFYALYYYPTTDRYWFNIISLTIFSAILILISTIALRRQKYDSI